MYIDYPNITTRNIRETLQFYEKMNQSAATTRKERMSRCRGEQTGGRLENSEERVLKGNTLS